MRGGIWHLLCLGDFKKWFFVSPFTVCGVDIVSLPVTKIKKDITCQTFPPGDLFFFPPFL